MGNRRWRLVISILFGIALLLFTGCGSGGANATGVATLGSSGSSGQDSKTKSGKAPTEAETQDAFRQYAACMREHGIEMQDPSSDGGGPRVVKPNGGSGPSNVMSVGGATVTGLSPDDPAFKSADAACKHFIEGAIANAQKNLDPKEVEKMKQQALNFAKCMREHGVDMPDPQFGENGTMTQSIKVDADSQQFQQAQEACKQYQPDGAVTQGAPGPTVGSAGSK